MNDPDRFQEVKVELGKLLQNDDLLKVPFLLFGNKSDLPYPKSLKEASDAMDLETLFKNRKWKFQKSCSNTGEGLFEGLEWIIDQL